jgi:hypothetical protein
MPAIAPPDMPVERRTEQRSPADRYYSVRFNVSGLKPQYQFKTWNISENGLCILVKEGAEILHHLRAGDVLNMTYYANEPQGVLENLRTRIKHNTLNESGRFKGHCLVGLAIV